MISEIFFSLLAKKLMDRHFFYCYWLKIDTEKIALPGERSQTNAQVMILKTDKEVQELQDNDEVAYVEPGA